MLLSLKMIKYSLIGLALACQDLNMITTSNRSLILFQCLYLCIYHLNLPYSAWLIRWYSGNHTVVSLTVTENHYSNFILSAKATQNNWRLGCLLMRLFRRRSMRTSKPHVTGLCERNPPVTDGFPSQRASNAENVSIWRHHDMGENDHCQTTAKQLSINDVLNTCDVLRLVTSSVQEYYCHNVAIISNSKLLTHMQYSKYADVEFILLQQFVRTFILYKQITTFSNKLILLSHMYIIYSRRWIGSELVQIMNGFSPIRRPAII